ncbi:MAG TPA: hypothetical protein VEA36_02670 [Candidatus Paceibacterota bacterium]|nr:hypothetical protein [Candidatus Paceibacterota bacterium]
MPHLQSAKAGVAISLLGMGAIAYGLTIDSAMIDHPLLLLTAPVFVLCMMMSHSLLGIRDFPAPRNFFEGAQFMVVGIAIIVPTMVALGMLMRWLDHMDPVVSGVAMFRWAARAMIVIGGMVLPLGFVITAVNSVFAVTDRRYHAPAA